MLPPWPAARPPLRGAIIGPLYDDSIFVTDEDVARAAREPEPGKGCVRWHLRRDLGHRRYVQSVSIHQMIFGTPDGRGVCTCGLLLAPEADLVQIRGHRRMPDRRSFNHVLLVTPSTSGSGDVVDVHCQRCGHHASGLTDHHGMAEREHITSSTGRRSGVRVPGTGVRCAADGRAPEAPTAGRPVRSAPIRATSQRSEDVDRARGHRRTPLLPLTALGITR